MLDAAWWPQLCQQVHHTNPDLLVPAENSTFVNALDQLREGQQRIADDLGMILRPSQISPKLAWTDPMRQSPAPSLVSLLMATLSTGQPLHMGMLFLSRAMCALNALYLGPFQIVLRLSWNTLPITNSE